MRERRAGHWPVGLLLGLLLTPSVGAALVEPPQVEEAPAGEPAAASVDPTTVYLEMTGAPQSELEDGLRISVDSSVLGPMRGYLPVQVLLHNTRAQARTVDVSVSGSMGGGELARRRVEVAAQREVSVWLPVTAAAQGGIVRVTGPGLSSRAFSFYVLQREDLTLVLGTRAEFDKGTGLSRQDEHGQMAVRFLKPEHAPRELAAYAGHSAVVVSGDVTALAADVWSALEAYAATGGTLMLLRPPRDVPQRLPLLFESRVEGAATPYGFGRVRLCAPGTPCGRSLFAEMSPARTHSVLPVNPVEPSPHRARYFTSDPQPLLPDVQAPVGRFLLLLSLFVLAVGPGGLWLVRRKGPAVLLLVVPGVSLFTCLAMVLWAVVVEGFALKAALYSITWLDRDRDRALTLGVGGYYANLEPDGFALSTLGVLLPPGSSDRTAPLEADWSQGQAITGGFLPSRTYQEWGELGVVPSRLRLSLRPGAEGPTVLNALGAPLEGGLMRWSGKTWSLPALDEGAEGRARLSTAEPEERVATPKWLPEEVVRRLTPEALAVMTEPLPEGGFLVSLGGRGPFTATAALDVELHEGRHVVRGRVDGP